MSAGCNALSHKLQEVKNEAINEVLMYERSYAVD